VGLLARRAVTEDQGPPRERGRRGQPRSRPSPTPTSAASPEPVTVSAETASSTESFNPAPLIFIIGGTLLAAALVWFVRPVRAAVARVVTRKDSR
jgi:hypothetical protein